MPFSCALAYSVFLTAVGYGIAISVITYFLVRVVILPKKGYEVVTTKRLFLVVSWLQLAGRLVYMIGWVILYGTGTSDCEQTLPSDSSMGISPALTEMMNIFGSLPAALFLTAFSVCLRSFARIFHIVTNEHLSRFQLFSYILFTENFFVYAACIGWYCSPDGRMKDFWSHALIWMLFGAEILLAIFILSYTYLLYRQFPVTMRTLLLSSGFSFICLLLKPVFILLLESEFDGVYTVWLFPLYFFVSELFPYVSMLYLNFAEGSKTVTLDVYSSLIPSTSTPHSALSHSTSIPHEGSDGHMSVQHHSFVRV